MDQKNVSFQDWLPQELVGGLRFTPDLSLDEEPPTHIDLRHGGGTDRLDPVLLTWLNAQLGSLVAKPVQVRELMMRTRGLQAESVLRARATNRSVLLPKALQWNGPRDKVGDLLVRMIQTKQAMLSTSYESGRELRFRLRLLLMDLESSIGAYAVTELVDPKILDSILSLDVLCQSGQLMDADVICRVGLARAYLDETELAMTTSASKDEMWPLAVAAWTEQMTYAKVVSRQWAEEVIELGRHDRSGWRIRG